MSNTLGDILRQHNAFEHRIEGKKVTEYFTLYWRDGKRQIITGESIEDAFTKAGYGAGAVAALDWFDTKPSDTHYWDKEKHEWIKRETVRIHFDDFNKMSKEEISALLDKYHSIEVEYQNKDVFSMELKYTYPARIGWVKVIEIVYGEYCQGSYDGENPDDHHYMSCGTQVFHPEDREHAVTTFMERMSAIGDEKFSLHGKASYDEIASKQYSDGEWQMPL